MFAAFCASSCFVTIDNGKLDADAEAPLDAARADGGVLADVDASVDVDAMGEGESGGGAPPGNVTVADPQSLFWDSGNYQRGATILQLFPVSAPNPAQNWAWTPSGGGFTVCNVGGDPCLSDVDGMVVMGSNADILAYTAEFAILDLTTGNYFQDSTEPPDGSMFGPYVTTGSTKSVWTLSTSLH